MSKTQTVVIVILAIFIVGLMFSITGLAMLNTELENVVNGNVLIVNGTVSNMNPGEIFYISRDTYEISYGLPAENKCYYIEDESLYYTIVEEW